MTENKQTIAISPSALLFLGVLMLALVGFGGYMYGKVGTLEKGTSTSSVQPDTAQQAAAPGATLDINAVKGVFDGNVIKFGDNKNKLLFVEISDPSCPYCHVAAGHNPELSEQVGAQFKYVSAGGSYQPPVPEMKKLIDSGKASFAFLYFPGHGNGELATKAMYCAFDQGKFWEVHDLLYSNKGYELLNNTVKNDVTQIGTLVNFLKGAVNDSALKTCLDSGKYDGRLADEQALSTTLMDPQQGGTPTFLVNETRFNGAYGWTEIKVAVDAVGN